MNDTSLKKQFTFTLNKTIENVQYILDLIV